MLKKHWEKILAPLSVLFILAIVFASAGLYPFGTNALDWGDMAQQNFPVMLQFKDVLAGRQGPLYSMVNAGGMDFLGMFLFLASSPFTFLCAFISKENLVFYINIMIALKLMTSAFTASLFFNRFFKGLTKLQIVALSVAYALCGYTMLFYQLHTWLDVMYMFPLLLIAFAKLIKENKFAPYTVCLSLMILFQFYLGYMIALYIIFGFALYLIFVAEKEDRKRNVFFFAIGTFLSVLLCAPVLFSAYNQYKNSARGVSIIDSLSKGTFVTALHTTLPFIFCTISLIVVFFLIRKKYLRDKRFKALFIMYAMIVLPILIDPINKMWHTGSYQAFPVRYGYMTVLMGLSVMAYVLCDLNGRKRTVEKNGSKSALAFVALLVLEFMIFQAWYVLRNGNILKKYSTTLWGGMQSFLLLLIYAVIGGVILYAMFYTYKTERLSKLAFSLLLCAFIFTEGIFNSSVYIGYGARTTDYYNEVISLGDKIKDDGTYRVKVNRKYFDVNLVGAMGYNSLAHYTSLIDSNYIYAMKKLGYSSYWMEVNSNDSTVFMDALLGNKYTIKSLAHVDSFKDAVYVGDRLNIMKNDLCLSLGTVIPSKVTKELETLTQTDRALLQNELYRKLTGSENDIVKKYNYTRTSGLYFSGDAKKTYYELLNLNPGIITYDIYVDGRQNLYFDAFDELTTNLVEPNYGTFRITVNGRSVLSKYPNKDTTGTINLGEFENETVRVSVSVAKSGQANSFGVFGIDMDELEKGLGTINQADVKVKNDTVTVNAKADGNDKSLMLTIPYSNGFSATVNGKKVEISKTLDAFMAIPLENGENKVELKYMSKGLIPGLAVGFTGLILLVGLSLFYRRRKHKEIKIVDNVLYYGFLSVAGIAFIAVYIFPVIVYITAQIFR